MKILCAVCTNPLTRTNVYEDACPYCDAVKLEKITEELQERLNGLRQGDFISVLGTHGPHLNRSSILFRTLDGWRCADSVLTFRNNRGETIRTRSYLIHPGTFTYTTEEVFDFIVTTLKNQFPLREENVFRIYIRNNPNLTAEGSARLHMIYNNAAHHVDTYEERLEDRLEKELLKVTAQMKEQRDAARKIMEDTVLELGYHPDPEQR